MHTPTPRPHPAPAFLRVGLLAAFICSASATVALHGATIGHWRFEQNAFFDDSGPHEIGLFSFNHPTTGLLNPSPTQYPLTNTGPGSAFPVVIGKAPNEHAAEGTGTTRTFNHRQVGALIADNDDNLTSALTVEVFVNLAYSHATQTSVLVGRGMGASDGASWCLAVTGATHATLGTRQLIFQMDGGGGSWGGAGFQTLATGLHLDLNTDYYIAVTADFADTSAAGITVYLKNLTAPDSPTQIAHLAHSGGIAPSDAPLVIGAGPTGASPWYGLIDEVRLSDIKLQASRLLLGSTIGHWRFEPGAFLTDSGPNGITLFQFNHPTSGTLNPLPNAYALPASGAGSTWAGPIDGYANTTAAQGTGTSHTFNHRQLGADVSTKDSDSTAALSIEAFVNLTSSHTTQSSVVVGRGMGASSGASWCLAVTGATHSTLGTRQLIFQLDGNGGSWGGTGFQTLASGLHLELNTDYYIAVTADFADTSTAGITVYLKNLSDAEAPMQVAHVAHSGGIAASDAPLVIGAGPTGAAPWYGLIDEVRFSRTKLHTDQLLVNQRRPEGIVFHLDFESGFTAQAAGLATPLQTQRLPSLVAGKHGSAAHFAAGQVLRYSAADNLPKDQGSLAMWFQAPEKGFGPITGGSRTLFREDGPLNGANTNAMWVWFHLGVGLRGDVRDPNDRYAYLNPLAPWSQGAWHHLVFSWDNTKGIRAYIDGEWVAESRATSWSPKFYEAFFIGASDATGLRHWNAAIDEVTIFNRILSDAEVRQEFLRLGAFTARVRVFEPYLNVAQAGSVLLELHNPRNKPTSLTAVSFTLHTANNVQTAQGLLTDQPLAAGDRKLVTVPLTATSAGEHSLRLHYTEDGVARMTEVVVHVYPGGNDTSTLPATETLITEINASAVAPLAQSAPSSVVSSPLGAYREAGPNRHDRFALDFYISAVGQPHVAVISYPDDKARTMEVLLHDLTGKKDYQAQLGVFTGDEYPLSHQMKEQRVVFWPRSGWQSFIFMTAEAGHPAAVANIKIYQLDRLPVAAPPQTFQGSVPAREIGIYYEDPVLNQTFGDTRDFDGYAQSMTRMMDYMQTFAQSTLHYPAAWYDGPLYGSSVEPLTQPTGVGGIRPHPPGYPAYFTRRLDARGMTFNAGLHMHALPSLRPFAIADLVRIHAGEETVLNIRADGTVWHGHYHGADPGYNPLDILVQNAVGNVVDEVVDRYATEPGFNGVSLVLARVKMFTFGSADSGYNGSNLVAFQADTGVSIPGYTPGLPARFSNASQWLRANPAAWESWINWRCVQLHAHYERIANAMTAKRADLKLTLNLFTSRADYERMSDYLNHDPAQAWREIGIDPALYAGNANITLSYTLVPADYRWRRGLNDSAVDLEANRTVFFAPESMAFLNAASGTEVTIHDRYWEDAIGRTAPMTALPVAEHGWRVSTFNAGGRNGLEPYATALNNLDALRITKGGFLIGTFGLETEIEEFTRAYRALPAVHFDDVPAMSDPARVRQKVVDGHRYLYVLNRLPETVQVTLTLNNSATLRDLSTGASIAPSAGQVSLTLKPFELRAFSSTNAAQAVLSGQATVPSAWLSALQQSTSNALADVAAIESSHPQEFARFTPYAQLAEQCESAGHYARLHFLLQEHWVKRARQLVAAP